jgi:hypothetical protein
MSMKNEQEIEEDDGQELCDECGVEYDRKEITTCSCCNKQFCKLCLDLHTDTKYLE